MTDQTSGSENEIILPQGKDELGRRSYTDTLTRTEDTRDKVILCKADKPVIPIIFLPGIMGTNLRNKKSKDPVWRPPNVNFSPGDILHAIGALFTWGFRGPAKRQTILDANSVEVDDRGSIDTGASGLNEAAARNRGWGTVMRSSYNPAMAVLEQELDNLLKALDGSDWQKTCLEPPASSGEELGKVQALTEAELKKASRYEFDVWCAGYNWLQSNSSSAQDVRDYIENTVLAHYRQHEILSEAQIAQTRVIVVTHSMGGLVSRALTEIHQCERVLGVVHGVQPASGAPAIYHHMRAGYEGLERIVLGANAGEVTAVVARSPGALELTPFADHRGGRPWLFVRDAQGNVLNDEKGQPHAYPRNDPYEEIYKSSAWYGLVPEQNNKYLDMSSKTSSNPDADPREKYIKTIDKVKNLHAALQGAYKSPTYTHYSADETMHSWSEVNWQGKPDNLDMAGVIPRDNKRGSYRGGFIGLFKSDAPELKPTRQPWPEQLKAATNIGGDGTVSMESGEAPGLAGITASFRHGSPKTLGAYNPAKGYEHQDSYNDPRARWATLYSIIKIAQLADWDCS